MRGLLASGCAGVGMGRAGLIVRTVRNSWQPAVVLASFFPYLIAVIALSLLLLVACRVWLAVAAAALVLVLALTTQVPLYVPSGNPAEGRAVVVLQANLRIGNADPGSLVARVTSEHADILTVEELTPAEATRLDAAGMNRQLPYQLVATDPGGAGTGVWSRYPLTDSTHETDFSFEILSTQVAVPGIAPIAVFAVHLLPPWPYPATIWNSELNRLRTLLDRATTRSHTVIASGDFNATLDNPQLRRLLGPSFQDADEAIGAGFIPTYPTDRWFPPILTLDHVLLHNADASSVRTVALPGSDHRGLVADLIVSS
jgi:endonuclease/exonuclease/phosphatase (EEP) superfamily protein YafD